MKAKQMHEAVAFAKPYYDQPERAYHNWAHVQAMLYELSSPVRYSDQLVLATIFHDVIYNPQSFTNEEDSAALFTRFYAENRTILPAVPTGRVEELILATKHHNFVPGDDELNRLMHADLAILCAPLERFQLYEQQIRQEYSFAPVLSYLTGRSAVIEKLFFHVRLYWGYFTQAEHERLGENVRWLTKSLADEKSAIVLVS
jgi:predicted metal-dependent HD superfamily phosphohydrolase